MVTMQRTAAKKALSMSGLATLFCALLPLGACVEGVEKNLCTSNVEEPTRARAVSLVMQFRTEYFGPEQSKIYSETYQVDSISVCGPIVKIISSPKPLPDVVGSTIHYDVDIVTGKVTQTFPNE